MDSPNLSSPPRVDVHDLESSRRDLLRWRHDRRAPATDARPIWHVPRRAASSSVEASLAAAPEQRISQFHPRSSTLHRPDVRLRIAYDDRSLHFLWTVHDRFVVARRVEPQSDVCHDSCVEMFLQPSVRPAYANLEVNAIGTILAHRTEASLRDQWNFAALDESALRDHVRIRPGFRSPITVELVEPVTWVTQVSIDFALFESITPDVAPARGHVWRANFYKCADRSSQPHWAAWSDIGEELRFHKPERFGWLHFEE